MLPSTPENWLYLESDCDGLSSDQVQAYSILTHLIWTTDVNVTRYRSCSVRRWFGENPSATITEKTNCIYEMNVAQNITDILLLSLVTELWIRLWWSSFRPMVPPDLIWTTDVNITRYRSCSKSQEVLDQTWRDSVPGKRSWQFLDLNNLNRWFCKNQAQQLQDPCASSS